MNITKLCDLIENEKYHYISAISGEAGAGTVWWENVITTNTSLTGKETKTTVKTYFYKFKCNGITELCHPCSLSTFIKAAIK